MTVAIANDFHFTHSMLRERVVEHVFVGEVLRRLWRLGVTDVEVLRSEFDAGGYDLVLSWKDVVRHIQFKTSRAGGRTASIKVGAKLAEKPSGCVIWIMVTDELDLQSYRWFGGQPGEPLPPIGDLKTARHTKANAQGHKAERLGHRVVPKSRFDQFESLDEVLRALFGDAIFEDSGTP